MSKEARDVSLEKLAPGDWPKWTSWLQGRDVSPFHRPEWLKIQADAFEGTSLCCAIRREGQILDIVPIVVRTKGPFRVGSSPVHVGTPYGGPGGQKIDRALASALIEFARRERISFLDIYLDPRTTVSSGVPLRLERHETYVINLGQSREKLLETVESRCRRAIRKAQRMGVTVRDLTPEDLAMYGEMARDTYAKQGRLPPLPMRVVKALLAKPELRAQVVALIAKREGEPLAAGVFPWGADTIYYVDGVAFRSGLRYAPNNLLHWTVIERALDKRLSRYDMVGASVRSIAMFKRSFGAEVVPHFRIYWGTPAGKLAYRAWQRIAGSAPMGES